MKLSICVPVFNYPIAGLASDICAQLVPNVELIVVDDGSALSWQKLNADSLSKWDTNLHFIQMPSNVGREKIRGICAEHAQGEYVLFLDCDSRIPNPNFVSLYLQSIDEQPSAVWVGGRLYPTAAPPQCQVHFWYGKKVESNSDRGFQSNNFCMKRDLFLAISKEQLTQGYGHEDTLMGLILQEKGIEVISVDNPIIHEGLDEDEAYLRKSKEAIGNLVNIYHSRFSNKVHNQIRIIQWWNNPLIRIILKVASAYYSPNRLQKVEAKLQTNPKSIWRLQLLKLLWFHQQMENRKKG